MSKVSILRTALKNITRSTKYTKIPEGMELFHSKNPIVGDKLLFNGQKLANGPLTFARQLQVLGYSEGEMEFLIELCEKNRELYPQFSAMLKNISPKHLERSSNRDIVITSMKKLSTYCEKHPESINNIKDYGLLAETLANKNMRLSIDDILKEGITDFKTITTMTKSCTHSLYDIPKILKESKIPTENLLKIWENQLKLTDKQWLSSMEGYDFRNHFLKVLNDDPKRTVELSKMLEKLASDKSFDKKFDSHEFEEIYKYLKEDWQIDFIKDYKLVSRIDRNSLHLVKNLDQGFLATEIENTRVQELIKGYHSALEKGVVDLPEQLEAYKYLLDKKMNGAIKSDYVYRFTGLAKENICKNIKSETDLEILKLMVEKQSVRGTDLYSSHAIVRVLEQDNTKKLKILEKLKQPQNINMKAYNEGLKNREYNNVMKNLESCNQGRVISSFGNTVKNEPSFQSKVRTLSGKFSKKELLNELKAGEVAEIGDKLFVTDGEKLVELKMDKAMFEKLFISNENLMQGWLGDCGCVATLDAIISTPKGKSAIYQLFEQVGDDIYITIKGFDKKIKFESGNYSNQKSPMGMFKGADGLKMLEQAIAISEHFPSKKLQVNVIDAYKDVAKEGNDWHNMMESIWGIYHENVLRKTLGENGYKIIKRYEQEDTILEKLKDLNPHKNKFAIFSTRDFKLYNDKNNQILPWHITAHHYHNIKGLNKFGKLTLTNPHDASFSAKPPVYEVLNNKIMDDINFCEII